ncbi:MAG: hypothetical protein HFJ09_01150 [Lachnospiraceae bacterium]|nr:hypothetical protein [Lachnospiraceae bacterium]
MTDTSIRNKAERSKNLKSDENDPDCFLIKHFYQHLKRVLSKQKYFVEKMCTERIMYAARLWR